MATISKLQSLRLLSLLLALLVASGTAHAAESATQVPEYRVKAVYLYNFIKFVSWPERATNDTNIQVCIIGADPFGGELSFLQNRQLQNRTIKVQSVAIDNVSGCHIAFISRSERYRLSTLLAALQYQPVLTVSDIDGFVDASGMFGFATSAAQIGLQINLRATQDAGLQVSSKLLEIATVSHTKATGGRQ